MKSGILALLLLAVTFPVKAQTADEKIVNGWLARHMMAGGDAAPLDMKTAEAQMKSSYALLSSRPSSDSITVTRRRGQVIGRFLERDMNNDGNVTSVELREVLALEASRPLGTDSGVSVEPTKEQVEIVLSQLLAKALLADENGDGTIDSAEIRRRASDETLEGFGRPTQIDLNDATAIRVLDTSGDKTISLNEFITGSKKVLVMMDVNKDGIVSLQEARPFARMRDTF